MAFRLQLFHGEDECLVERRVREEIGEGTAEEIDGRASTRDECAKFLLRFAEAVGTAQLFSAGTILWLKDVSLFSAAAPWDGSEDRFFSEIDRAERAGTAIIISACPVDRRLRSFKRACADRRFTVCEVAGGDAALARLLHRELRRRNLTVGGGVELSLLENSPAARSLLGELEKLENHAAPGRHIGMEDIAAVHCGGGTDNFFSIGDAFFCRDTAGLADKLRQFFSAGGEPRALLASLLGNCRLLLQLHALGGSGGGCPTARRAMDSVRRRQFSEISPGEGWKSPVEKNAFLRRRLAPHLPRWTVGELRSLQVAIGHRFEEWITGGGEAGWWEDELLALALKFPAEEKNSPDRGDGKW